MVIYPVKIELLSETTFGSGESQNGRVNEDILLDNKGLPYFLGKTFKGCLRKNIEDILKPFYLVSKQKGEFCNIQQKLFGIGENEDIKCQKHGKLKFSNFYLHKDILKLFNKSNKDEILDVLTDIRFSIKMDEDSGVAKDGSLRATRVLKKGLVFVGSIECEDKLEDNELKFLQQGILSVKNLGINKSRGKGQVKITIDKKIEANNNNKNKISEDCNYLFYEINLREPVKIGDSTSKYDYEESKLYITGSSIRGAIINKYLAKESLDLDILKKVYFSNGYPIYWDGQKRYSFPTPNVFVISKDTDKSDISIYNKEKFSNLLDMFKEGQFRENNIEEEERRVIKLRKGSFSYYVEDKKTLYQFDVNKDFRFHHTNDKEKENIFRYESISKNQQFYGIIDISKLDKDSKKKFINVLESLSIFYLGGSRTGGYGKTEIINIKGIKDFSELKEHLNYLNCGQNTKEINDIYLLSDVMLRDKNHQIISNFSEEYLKENLKDNTIKILNSQINPTIIKGFNSTWKSHIPQGYAMEKGSVIRIKGDLDSTKIDKFIKMYHGDKVQDGLGRVIVNPVFLDANSIIKHKNYQGCIFKCKDNIEYTHVDKKIIEKFIKLRSENYIDKKIKEYLNRNLEKESLYRLSLSQINNVIYEIDKCIMDEKNEKQYLDKLQQTSTNKSKTENNRNILNIKIDDKVSLQDVLSNEITEYKLNLLEKVFGNNSNTINEIDKNKSLLKVLRWKLYYITKIIKMDKYKKEGGKHDEHK